MTAGLKGRYQLTVRRPDGSVRLQTPWFDNLILTQGLNRLGTAGVASHCHVGSGSTAPLVTDSGMQTFIAATSTKQSTLDGQQNSAPYYGWHRRTFRFAAGVAAGNVSEVGIGWGASGAVLISRALVRDVSNNPMTITILPGEVLDVSYELRIYPPAETNFNVTISGVTYACVMRAADVLGSSWAQVGLLMDNGAFYGGIGTSGVYAYAGPLGAVTATPSGSQSGASSSSVNAYSNNSNQRVADLTFGLNNGNVSGGIGALSVSWYGLGAYQFSFDPKIPKDNTKMLVLKFALSWTTKTM
jgi:hypothetical protein